MDFEIPIAQIRIKQLDKINTELLEACRVASQLASIADDWNLNEVEIDEVMIPMRQVKEIFDKAIKNAEIKNGTN